MRTKQKDLILKGKYKNQMWNQVKKIDPAYLLWAQNTQPDVQFSPNFLRAAKIDLVNEWNHYGDNSCFND